MPRLKITSKRWVLAEERPPGAIKMVTPYAISLRLMRLET